MGSTAYAAYNNGLAIGNSSYTVTAMGRWSILNKQLPGLALWTFLVLPARDSIHRD